MSEDVQIIVIFDTTPGAIETTAPPLTDGRGSSTVPVIREVRQ